MSKRNVYVAALFETFGEPDNFTVSIGINKIHYPFEKSDLKLIWQGKPAKINNATDQYRKAVELAVKNLEQKYKKHTYVYAVLTENENQNRQKFAFYQPYAMIN